ncbi:MAG: DUF6338 family protein [Janthinobacterium lividum]
MKLENTSDIYFILAVLAPGFIYNGVLAHFIPLHQNSEKALVLLRLLTATAFNYALCSPLIYLLATNALFPHRALPQGIVWFLIIFVVPAVLGLARASVIQRDRGAWFYRVVRLRPINPIPTGWDWIFGRTDPCYVLVTLTDGTEIAGFFGSKSMASSDPERKDLYIEKVYKVPADDGPWTEVEGTLGMHIDGAQISYIEFKE